MKIKYSNKKVEQQCTNLKKATKLFGGDKKMGISLLSRINLIEQANVIKDIVQMKNLRFHNLSGKLKGYFAIDVRQRSDKWRLILRPLDDEEMAFDPCNIDEIASVVNVVEIKEVSGHYE